MESSHAERVAAEALNFAISTEPLQTIGGSRIFQADKYLAIYDNASLLGVKPWNKELAQLVFNHHQAHQLGQTLFQELFGNGTSQICFLTQDKSWMASLIGEAPDQQEAYQTLFPHYQDSLLADEREYHRFRSYGKVEDFDYTEQLAHHGFRPSIGVVNGFDYNDHLAFYLLVEPIGHRSENLPVLTLASFKFSERQLHDVVLQPSHQRDAYALDILTEAAQPVFAKELNQFLKLYKHLAQWPAQQVSLTAISLDLHNKNRNVVSIEVDSVLAAELRRFITAADTHFCNQTDMSSIIDFIIRYNEFDFDRTSHLRTKIEQIFVRKRSYQKMTRVFARHNPDSVTFEKYLNEQIRSYEQTNAILASVPA